jgi:hypothetical protein
LFHHQVGVVLLENPVGSGLISKAQLVDEISTLFGLDPYKKQSVFADSSLKQEISDNLATLDGKVVFIRHETSRVAVTCDEGSVCRFFEVEHGGKKATILIENPSGCNVAQYAAQVLAFFFFRTII